MESNWTVFQEETRVVSVMIERLETDATRDKEGQSSSLAPKKRRHTMTERNPQKVQVAEGTVLLEEEAEFRADTSLGESVRTRHVITGTFPCVSITSLNQDAHMAKNAESDTLELMCNPV